jgi:hypothetical protein
MKTLSSEHIYQTLNTYKEQNNACETYEGLCVTYE